MKSFWARFASLLLIAGLVIYYQSVTVTRTHADEVTELQNQIEEAKAETAKYKAIAEANSEASASSASKTNSANSSESEGDFVDGVYTGEAQGYGGPIDVSVSVESGKIASITVTSHANEDASYYSMAESVVDEIINQQTTAVDTVTGATFSSAGIINAVADALQEAVK